MTPSDSRGANLGLYITPARTPNRSRCRGAPAEVQRWLPCVGAEVDRPAGSRPSRHDVEADAERQPGHELVEVEADDRRSGSTCAATASARRRRSASCPASRSRDRTARRSRSRPRTGLLICVRDEQRRQHLRAGGRVVLRAAGRRERGAREDQRAADRHARAVADRDAAGVEEDRRRVGVGRGAGVAAAGLARVVLVEQRTRWRGRYLRPRRGGEGDDRERAHGWISSIAGYWLLHEEGDARRSAGVTVPSSPRAALPVFTTAASSDACSIRDARVAHRRSPHGRILDPLVGRRRSRRPADGAGGGLRTDRATEIGSPIPAVRPSSLPSFVGRDVRHDLVADDLLHQNPCAGAALPTKFAPSAGSSIQRAIAENCW